MPVFKYRDPNSGEWINVAGGGGGAANIPIQDEPPTSGDLWVDTSEEGASGSVDAYTKEETLSEEAKETLGLAVSAVPADAFMALAGNASGGVKIVTGSYTGTGVVGKNNKTSITLDFVPSFILVARKVMDTLVGSKNMRQMDIMVLYPSIGGFSAYDMTTDYGKFYSVGSEVNGNTISWWSYAVETQMNVSGATYSYVAIG